ncbi:unnamed protein product [Psylliodes chrysocephalus]|uniref:Uncharacterized protein n=1 Tax=Psylliodes chrysocephalus TaxID=3402493 RepID=A0A9P0GE42_9CUCU|nr:unnamed protein product [Psylliodes chrysocephala]
MSPASAGNLEVERYIGACLISQNRAKTKPTRQDHFVSNSNRDVVPDVYHKQHVNFRLQRCHSVEGWAGGVPLISFAQHQRKNHKNDQEDPGSLARLAVHTQGAPLILTKSFNHRKNKVNRNNGTTKVFENSNNKKNNNKCQNSADAVSVTSDESSGSANSETCLPRIIKPRKRRKKDRKPPLLGRPLSQDGFSTDSASPEIDNTQSNYLSLSPFNIFNFNPYGTLIFPDSAKLVDQLHILSDISETPKLHHSFEDIEELDDGKDINGNQPTSTCQCRYCDPSGQIWDVDRECYSPFLTPPTKSFQFPTLNLEDISYTSPLSMSCLEHSLSSISLENEGRNKKTPTSRSSSSSSCRDLEVSTEIVTSLNGHRDIEIKFFSMPSSNVDSVKSGESRKCVPDNELSLAYEE